jgi:hypothetical protein
MDIEQLLKEEELAKFPPVNVTADYSATIIVDNLPVIPREKEARLVGIVRKVFEYYGKILDFHMPFINESQSAGKLFYLSIFNHFGECPRASSRSILPRALADPRP